MEKILILGDLKFTIVADEDDSDCLDITIEAMHNGLKPLKTSCEAIDLNTFGIELDLLTR